MSAVCEGRTAIVTGASGGIGLATARQLAAAGAQVYLCGRARGRLDEAVKAIREAGGMAEAAPLDVRDAAALEAVVARAVAETGGLHVMVNNAGLDYPSPIADGDPDRWREMLEVNVLGVLVGCRAAIRAMREHGCEGHLVNVSSIHGRMEATGVYGATKSAVNAISRSLRRELEGDAIRVVNVVPGGTASSFARNFPDEVLALLRKAVGPDVPIEPGEPFPPELIAALERTPEIMATPEDVARVILYAVTQPIALNLFEIEVRPQRHVEL